ncbi:MAG TPA: efflux RND transporter periplasmic adaptor subunit [Burkholderiaceae bacterium]|jgi:RND family efflux transporter MFP subunit|nr:efflux RND transporter periplasmic adaptor subunit [Burkholderiaceae bacterium]HRA78469.1 efflux RND transporter periplasmic adaptor subunit [Burkholderiaceae bacterium]
MRIAAWIVGCAGVLGVLATASPAAGQGAAATGAPTAVARQVAVRPAARLFVYPEREAAASVVARNESRIASQLSATIASVDARVGERVRRGAVLARLDDTDFRLALDRAQAQREAQAARLKLAEAQLARARELQARGFFSPEALNQRDAEVASLRAELKALDAQLAGARRDIARTLVRAPFDAVVRERSAQLGELAAPGAVLFVLTDSGAPEVSAAVPADDAPRLPTARSIEFESGGTRRSLRLVRLSPVIDPASRTQEARLAFAGEPLPPGAAGRLLWRDSRPHVPAASIVRRDGALGVFVVDERRARFVPVPDAQEGRAAPASLGEDAMVVVDGQAGLRDGDPVVLLEAPGRQ